MARPRPRPAQREPALPRSSDAAAPEFISYGEFGHRFLATAVTRERITHAAGRIAGRPIEFGPNSVGPMKLVKVSATGTVGEPRVEPRDHPDLVAFEVLVPIDLKLVIATGPDKHRFTAAALVHLRLVARAADPLLVVIDVSVPGRDDVEVRVTAEGLRASVVQAAGRVDDELRRTVAKVVARELAGDEVQQALVIDVAKALQRRD